jgi:hypothetical protein
MGLIDFKFGVAMESKVSNTLPIGPFEWRCPTNVESFEGGWEADAVASGQKYEIRHGVGRREVYGRERRHTLTWVNGKLMVEGVESDDFERTKGLLSLTKMTKKHVRPGDPIPNQYEGFTVPRVLL